MTKEVFVKFYKVFAQLIDQRVNDTYCMQASAHLIDHCGGYELELHPKCLLWGRELALINALCDKFALSFECRMYDGRLTIR